MNNKNNLRLIIVSILCTIILAIVFFYIYRLSKNIEEIKKASAPSIIEDVSKKEIIQKITTEKCDLWSEIQPKVKDCVVQIFSQVAEFDWLEPYKTPNQTGSSGTGFFINDQGHLISNAHVVNQAKAISIQIPSLGKEQFDVEVIGICFERDLALLKIRNDEDLQKIKKELGRLPFLEFGDSQKVVRATEVMVLGYPLGHQYLKSTKGIVSGRISSNENRFSHYLIQIDAPINPGNSGGPVMNIDGQVIGIASSYRPDAQNVGYIITVNELKNVLNDLYNAKNKLLRKPFLGVFYNAGNGALTNFLNNPMPGGCYVTGVYKGSLLDSVGIKAGDMLYEINKHPIDVFGEISIKGYEDKMSLIDYVSFIPLNTNVNLVVYRKGKKIDFNFKFQPSKLPEIRIMYPDFENIDFEIIGGMVVMQLSRNHLPYLLNMAPELIRYEEAKNQTEPVLVITHVHPDSQSQRSRVLVPGTRIKEVNGVEVKTLADFRDAVKKSLDTKYLTVKSYNDIFTVFPFKKILEDELRLPNYYKYPVTPLVQDLMKEFIKKNEKEAGSNTARKAAAA